MEDLNASYRLDPAFEQTTNLIIPTSEQDPGLVNIGGTVPGDFDLLEPSPAINAGTAVPEYTLDFLNRPVPDASGVTDVGAFEFGSGDPDGNPPSVPDPTDPPPSAPDPAAGPTNSTSDEGGCC